MNDFDKKIETMFQQRKAQIDHFGKDFAESRYKAASNEERQFMGSAGALRELLIAIELNRENKVTIEDILQAIKGRIESYYVRQLAAEKECIYISEKLAAFEGGRNE